MPVEHPPSPRSELLRGHGKARFRFYAELNDFLPPERRVVSFVYTFSGRRSVKHVIESLGVPHTEVDLILVDGRSVAFSHIVEDGDRVSVYPTFEAIDIRPLLRVRAKPLRKTRFVLDAHLGRLAVYLRMLGFDTLYRNDYEDKELSQISSCEGRILLTRDRGLLKRSKVTHGYCVRESCSRRQLTEVVRRFDLVNSISAFRRCLRCNELLAPVPKEAVRGRVPPFSRDHSDEFRQCPVCERVYWKGSHYRRMARFIEDVADSASQR